MRYILFCAIIVTAALSARAFNVSRGPVSEAKRVTPPAVCQPPEPDDEDTHPGGG